MQNTSRLGPLPCEGAPEALAGLSAQRRRVLDAVVDLSGRSDGRSVAIASVAAELDLHVNTAREHLDGLVAAGLAHRSRLAPSGRGRPGWGYTATRRRSAAASEYVTLARVLADHVAERGGDLEADMVDLGRRWGRAIAGADAGPEAESGVPPSPGVGAGNATGPAARDAANDTVVRLLDDLGFDPEVSGLDPAPRVRLRRCPMLEVARERPGVVCNVHRGIVEGVLQAEGANAVGVRLQAFAEPGACILHLPPVPQGLPGQPGSLASAR